MACLQSKLQISIFFSFVYFVFPNTVTKDEHLTAALPAKFLRNRTKAYVEEGYEDYIGIICKTRSTSTSEKCSTTLNRLTISCQSKHGGSSCIKHLNTMKDNHPTFISIKVKSFKSIENSMLDLGACCEYLEVDQEVAAILCPSVPPPWGLDRIDDGSTMDTIQDYYPAGRGQNSVVFVLDTGIYQGHSEFQKNGGSKVLGSYSVIGTLEDDHGHGTHVAGTVAGKTYGVAKDALLYSVKVLDRSGSGSVSGVISALDWVGAQCAPSPSDSAHPGKGWFKTSAGQYVRCVATMSLGCRYVQSLNEAVSALVYPGNVPVTVAAGNAAADASDYSPASAPLAITVGASDSSDASAYFSNFGKMVDVFAPGVGITSAWVGSTTATATYSGTSMATPHAAGAVAILLSSQSILLSTEVLTGLLKMGLGSKIAGRDGCQYTLLQVLRSSVPTCDGDQSRVLDLNVPWMPSPCGGCPGVSASCSSTPSCTQGVPRSAGCNCLYGSDCISGICTALTNKCSNGTAPSSTTPPPSCDTGSPCSKGDQVCDSLCCNYFGLGYFSVIRLENVCYCSLC